MPQITFFDYIQPLFPYLHSIRKINEAVTLDMKFPAQWQVEVHMEESEKIFLKLQHGTPEINLFSFLIDYSANAVNKVFNRIIYIIDKNIEAEKKQQLLDKKIEELKQQFNTMSLEELQQLKFLPDEEKHELITDAGSTSERNGA